MRARAGLVLAIASVIWGAALPAQTICRQALALGLDVSGSVDAQEYRLQLDGLANALGDPQVVHALLGIRGSYVRIMVYEWSGQTDQRIVLDWTTVQSPSDLAAIQTRLWQTKRAPADTSTGLGDALVFGFDQLAIQSDCGQRTLDISGDGKSNTGPRPQDVADGPADIIVNGLVIGSDDVRGGDERSVQLPELTAYYTAYVIRGPSSFIETAIGFQDYEEAMRRKLLRELAVLVMGGATSSKYSEFDRSNTSRRAGEPS